MCVAIKVYMTAISQAIARKLVRVGRESHSVLCYVHSCVFDGSDIIPGLQGRRRFLMLCWFAIVSLRAIPFALLLPEAVRQT